MFLRFLLLALAVGLMNGYILYSTPVYLTFQTALNNCARHETKSGCLSSSKAGCLWINDDTNASSFTCQFPDYETVNCSLLSNNSKACNNFNHGKSCSFRFRTEECVHRAGFNDVETGVFSASTVVGGIFGPFSVGKFDKKFGNVTTLFLLSFISLLSAVLFTIGIENGELGLWVTSKILSSIVGVSGASLFPGIMTDESTLEPSTKQLFTTLLGLMTSTAGFLAALFLYLDTPRDQFEEDPVFKIRLQMFNLVQWLTTVGYVVFALAIKYPKFFDQKVCFCLDDDDDDDEKKKKKERDDISKYKAQMIEEMLQRKNKEDDDESSLEPPIVDIDYDEEELQTVSESEKPSVKNNEPTSAASVSDETTSASSVSIEMANNYNNSGAKPDDAKTDYDRYQSSCSSTHSSSKRVNASERDKSQNKKRLGEVAQFDEDDPELKFQKHLQWISATCTVSMQQFIGMGVVISFIPILTQDLLDDPLLAELLFSLFLMMGALFGVAVLARFFTPIQIFVGMGQVCAAAALVLGISLHPSIISDREGVAQPLSLFGVALFAFVFGAGPSAMFFPALSSTFRIPGTLTTGVSASVGIASVFQVIIRFLFPVFVSAVSPEDPRLGRAIAFFGFSGMGTLLAGGVTLTRRFVKKEYSA